MMTKHYVVNRNTNPKYQSTTVSKNDDGTYEVKHIFANEQGNEITVKYPRVNIMIDATIDYPNHLYTRVFPYSICQPLPSGENEELFEITIKD